jgi:uncharacterized protein (TIRG00374 family)
MAMETHRWADGEHGELAGGAGSLAAPRAPRRARGALRWLSWTIGIALLAAVIIAAFHYSEQRQFLQLTAAAQPWWVAIAIALQVATYFAQGETWRVVLRAARVRLPVGVAFKLSLTKLFIDQALPSAGISGTLVVARVLGQRGLPRAVVVAAMIIDTVSYYAAYLLTLAGALLITVLEGHASALIIIAAVFFVVFCALLTTAALVLSGRKSIGPRWLGRVPYARALLARLNEADPRLVRNLPLILRSAIFQLAIVLLDAATVWVLIRSLGQVASPAGVFASFVLSTLLRTVSVVPGGLGAFEAAAVVTLKFVGVRVPVALAATLMFRGLSFWLPMVPGLVFSRGARKAA